MIDRILPRGATGTENLNPAVLLTRDTDNAPMLGQMMIKALDGSYAVLGAPTIQNIQKISGQIQGAVLLVLLDTEGENPPNTNLNIIETIKANFHGLAGDSVPLIIATTFPESIPEVSTITKPFNIDLLRSTIAEAFGRDQNIPVSAPEKQTPFKEVEKEVIISFLSKVSAYFEEILNSDWFLDLKNSLDEPQYEPIKKDWGGLESSLTIGKSFVDSFLKSGFSCYENFRKFFHDINNKLTVIPYSQLISSCLPGGDEHAEALNDILRKFKKFVFVLNVLYQSVIGEKVITPAICEEAESADVDFELVKLEVPKNIKSILVVEDDPVVASVLKAVLGKNGRNVRTVHNREGLTEIIEKTRSSGGYFNLVILDNDLGDGLFGHQLIEEIRAAYPDVPIIVNTGDAAALEADENSPYKKAGLPISGKNDFARFNEILKPASA